MLRFWAVLRVDLVNLFKNPVLVGYNTVFGVLMIIILGYLTGGNYAAGRTAYQYFAITFLIYGMLAGAMTAANCFMERDIKGANLRIIYSPVGSFSLYFSKVIAAFIFDLALHSAWAFRCCPRQFRPVSSGSGLGTAPNI